MKKLIALLLCIMTACTVAPGISDTGDSGTDSGDPSKRPIDRYDSGRDTSAVTDSGTDSSDEGFPPDPPPPPARAYKHYDINHVLVVGQSNSVSNSGRPVLSTTQPFNNLMFNTGVMPMQGSKSNTGAGCDGEGCTKFQAPTSFVPLKEGDGFFSLTDGVETASSGAANAMSFLFKQERPNEDHNVLVSLHGRSGNTYWCLRKGGCNYKQGYLVPFDQGMMEVSAAKALAAAQGKSYIVRGVLVVHGESDHYSYTAGVQEFPIPGSDGTYAKIKDYADALIEWQQDYEAGVKAITGQTEPVPLFVSQLSGWNDARTSKVAQMQLDAHVRAPGKVILVGPSYSLSLNQQDCLHFTSKGERQLGEMFARAYARTVFDGRDWEPLRPTAYNINGQVLSVKFAVEHPPLVIDAANVAEVAGYGFEFGNIAITAVGASGPDTLKIVLASPPPPGHYTLRYAQNQPVPGCAGTPNGARGNLRDSDPSPSRNGYDQHNWAVMFEMGIDVQ